MDKSQTHLPFPLPELPRIPSVEFNLRAFGAVEGGLVLNTVAATSHFIESNH